MPARNTQMTPPREPGESYADHSARVARNRMMDARCAAFARGLAARGHVVIRRLYAHQRILARHPWHDDAVFAETGISFDNLWNLDTDERNVL